MDWSDKAWLEFFDTEDIDCDTESKRRLKRAWLAGAQAGIDKALEVIREQAPPKPE